jgi:hypothetical protein
MYQNDGERQGQYAKAVVRRAFNANEQTRGMPLHAAKGEGAMGGVSQEVSL